MPLVVVEVNEENFTWWLLYDCPWSLYKTWLRYAFGCDWSKWGKFHMVTTIWLSIQNEKWHQSFDMKTGQPILQVTCHSENKWIIIQFRI